MKILEHGDQGLFLSHESLDGVQLFKLSHDSGLRFPGVTTRIPDPIHHLHSGRIFGSPPGFRMRFSGATTRIPDAVCGWWWVQGSIWVLGCWLGWFLRAGNGVLGYSEVGI